MQQHELLTKVRVAVKRRAHTVYIIYILIFMTCLYKYQMYMHSQWRYEYNIHLNRR